MDKIEKERINNVVIVGTVTEVKNEIKVSKAGARYISGSFTVKCEVDGKILTVVPRFLSMEKKKDGSINKMFTKFSKAESYLNKRVRIVGSLSENFIPKPESGLVERYNEIRLGWIEEAKEQEKDCAKFEYSGFVTRPLYEKNNKEGKLYGYKFEVGQQDYNGTNLVNISFDIDMQDVNIVKAVQSAYTKGTTVIFNGILDFVVEERTEVTPVAFGSPTEKTIIVTNKMYKITGGKEPLVSGPTVYDVETINKLTEAYNMAKVNRLEEAKARTSTSASNTSVSAQPVQSNRFTSLI